MISQDILSSINCYCTMTNIYSDQGTACSLFVLCPINFVFWQYGGPLELGGLGPLLIRHWLRWLDNTDSHLKGKSTSLKEVIGTKCFENRQDGRNSISRSTDRSSGEDPWTPTWSMVSKYDSKAITPGCFSTSPSPLITLFCINDNHASEVTLYLLSAKWTCSRVVPQR